MKYIGNIIHYFPEQSISTLTITNLDADNIFISRANHPLSYDYRSSFETLIAENSYRHGV